MSIPPTCELDMPNFDERSFPSLPDDLLPERRLTSAQVLTRILDLSANLDSDFHVLPQQCPRYRTETNQLVPAFDTNSCLPQEESFALADEFCSAHPERLNYLRSVREQAALLEQQSSLPPSERRIDSSATLQAFDVDYEAESLDSQGMRRRFRVHVYFVNSPKPSEVGLSFAIRRILPEPWSPDLLGANSQCRTLIDQIAGGQLGNGLVLISGPTGNGKSTLLTTILETLNERLSRSVTIFEDPIEYIYVSKRCLIRQIRINRHVANYDQAEWNALRQDTDIVCIHEIRDSDAAEFAVRFAATGHLVLATIHANSTLDALERMHQLIKDRIVDPLRLLANYTSAVIWQRLLDPNQELLDQYLEVPQDAVRRYLVQEVVRPNENETIQTVLATQPDPKKWTEAIGKGNSLLDDSPLFGKEIAFDDALYEAAAAKTVAALDAGKPLSLSRISINDAVSVAFFKGELRRRFKQGTRT